MKEQRYWYLKCKICKNLHRSEIAVTDSSRAYEFPTAGEIECPDNPRKKAHYSPSQDWIAMTEAERSPVMLAFRVSAREEHEQCPGESLFTVIDWIERVAHVKHDQPCLECAGVTRSIVIELDP